MFKSKEELIKEYRVDNISDSDLQKCYVWGMEKAFESFSERIDFYYAHKQRDETDFTGLYNKFIESKFKYWDDFLFNYCFGDVKK
jgi:hypothetical protein